MSPMTVMQRAMLEAAVKCAVNEEVGFQNWPQFRGYLVENGCLSAAELDEVQLFVFECYLKYNSTKKQELFSHPDTPPGSPEKEGEPRIASCNSTPLLHPWEGPDFSPTLDASQLKRSENLSIFVPHEETWDGACWDFCTQPDSFISTALVQRQSLTIQGDRTLLTWKFHGEKKTYRTWFIIIPDKNMENDIMLGKNWENVENKPRADSPRHSCDQEVDQLGGVTSPTVEHFPVQQGYLDLSAAATPEYIKELEDRAARMSVQQAICIGDILQNRFQSPLSYPRGEAPIRRRVEDARSDSSGSQRPEKRLDSSLLSDSLPRSAPRNPRPPGPSPS